MPKKALDPVVQRILAGLYGSREREEIERDPATEIEHAIDERELEELGFYEEE